MIKQRRLFLNVLGQQFHPEKLLRHLRPFHCNPAISLLRSISTGLEALGDNLNTASLCCSSWNNLLLGVFVILLL